MKDRPRRSVKGRGGPETGKSAKGLILVSVSLPHLCLCSDSGVSQDKGKVKHAMREKTRRGEFLIRFEQLNRREFSS